MLIFQYLNRKQIQLICKIRYIKLKLINIKVFTYYGKVFFLKTYFKDYLSKDIEILNFLKNRPLK